MFLGGEVQESNARFEPPELLPRTDAHDSLRNVDPKRNQGAAKQCFLPVENGVCGRASAGLDLNATSIDLGKVKVVKGILHRAGRHTEIPSRQVRPQSSQD